MTGEILFLAHRVPYPPDRGDKIRSWHMLRALARLAPVHVAALCDDERDLAHLDTLQGVAASVTIESRGVSRAKAVIEGLTSGGSASVRAFASAALEAHVARLLATRPISTVFAFSGQTAQFVPRNLRARFVMDFVDMDSAKYEAWAKAARGPAAWANASEARRLLAFERETARRADLSLFVSETEASLFRAATGLGTDRVIAVENGIDLDAYDPAIARPRPIEDDAPLIVFTGQMDYRPNIEAVRVFASEALPLIRARRPDARFAIVGRSASPEVEALAARPGVVVTGEVRDTRDWLAVADVVVAPLRLARGIQNKVLEAMAMAKAVVVSPDAAEGIDAQSGAHFVVADGSAAEAEAVCALLDDRAQAAAIGDAARARMVERYSWEARLSGIPAIVGLERAAA